jgi:hypothetical protein
MNDQDDFDDGFSNGPMYTSCDVCDQLVCPIIDGVAETVCDACDG